MLYLAITNNTYAMEDNVVYELASELAAIAFSLWRAAFLSDVEEKDILGDAQDFIAKLISHNTIGYQQDRNSKGWSFYYYLTNAEQRLAKIADGPTLFLDRRYIGKPFKSAKDRWSNAQKALKEAVENLQKHIEAS